jgi:hypothetical protein
MQDDKWDAIALSFFSARGGRRCAFSIILTVIHYDSYRIIIDCEEVGKKGLRPLTATP